MVGLAVILALTVGLATTALAGKGVGARFDLGKTNTVNAISKLAGSVAGPSLRIDNNSTDAAATALDLQVEPGKAAMKVNSDAHVANLNSDKLDGKSANEIGVNGLARSSSTSPLNSDSFKIAIVNCPAGKVLVGSGFDIQGGKGSAGPPNTLTDVVVDRVEPISTGVQVEAIEEESTTAPWTVTAYAMCATAP